MPIASTPSTRPVPRLPLPRLGALVRRAGSHRPGTACLGLLLVALGAASCGSGNAQGAPEEPEKVIDDAGRWIPPDAPVSEEARAEIAELIELMMPLDPTLTSDHHDRHFIAGQQKLFALLEEREEIGWAALHAYCNYDGEHTLVKMRLLDVGSHCAPETARPILLELMLEYGYAIDDRTYATVNLARTSPDVYLEAAREYVLRRDRKTKTMPDDEFLVAGWAIACAKLGRSPVPEMADVVTNLRMDPAARYHAAEVLGQHADPLARAALETALIESTGDGYLRRKAAQALRDSLPRETACSIFQRVLEKEVDYNFGLFLTDLIHDNCR